jgi:tRNA threonylcarbamoyladenosine biosynthesis protein TsaB
LTKKNYSKKNSNFAHSTFYKMGLLLHIETAETICSVALSENDKIISIKESKTDKAHASQLTVLIDQLFKNTSHTIEKLNAVSVSMGPGSYTGLRIGVSAAKGICYALNIPLIGINTLKALANGFLMSHVSGIVKQENSLPYIICPLIDARRMEVYAGLYSPELAEIQPVRAEIIDITSFADVLQNNKVVFIGSGANKCKDVINHTNALIIDHFIPHADYLVDLAFESYKHKRFDDCAYFEPFYLKDFVATTSKKNMIGLTY